MKPSPDLVLLRTRAASFGTAHAETADSEQPIQIFSDKFDGDDVKQVAIYTGDVAVHQGTLEIHGNKLVLTVDPQGYRHAVMTPLKGKLVTFKQRRDQKRPALKNGCTARVTSSLMTKNAMC